MILAFAAVAITGLAVSIMVVWLVARYGARVGLLDVPNQRSSHSASIPRGGGVGVLAGVAAGILVFSVAGMPPTRPLGWLLLGAATMAALGAIDDVHSKTAARTLWERRRRCLDARTRGSLAATFSPPPDSN